MLRTKTINSHRLHVNRKQSLQVFMKVGVLHSQASLKISSAWLKYIYFYKTYDIFFSLSFYYFFLGLGKFHPWNYALKSFFFVI